jgi:hypothetical protein
LSPPQSFIRTSTPGSHWRECRKQTADDIRRVDKPAIDMARPLSGRADFGARPRKRESPVGASGIAVPAKIAVEKRQARGVSSP